MLLACAFPALLFALAGGDATSPTPGVATPSAGPAHRQREGTVVRDLEGVFENSGERISFRSSEGGSRYVVLENLCLDRVERLIAERGAALTWSVDGTLTECRGANYLLLTRVNVRREAPRPSAQPRPEAAPAHATCSPPSVGSEG